MFIKHVVVDLFSRSFIRNCRNLLKCHFQCECFVNFVVDKHTHTHTNIIISKMAFQMFNFFGIPKWRLRLFSRRGHMKTWNELSWNHFWMKHVFRAMKEKKKKNNFLLWIMLFGGQTNETLTMFNYRLPQLWLDVVHKIIW